MKNKKVIKYSIMLYNWYTVGFRIVPVSRHTKP